MSTVLDEPRSASDVAADQMVRPEPFAESPPENPLVPIRTTEEWSVSDLEDHARTVVRKIRTAEALLTPMYWELGDTLLALRGEYHHGEWLGYLSGLGVSKTRWEKAKAIRETFSTVDACRHLSVAEAYETRERKQVQDHRGTNDNDDAEAQVELDGQAKAKQLLGIFAESDDAEGESLDQSDDGEAQSLDQSDDGEAQSVDESDDGEDESVDESDDGEGVSVDDSEDGEDANPNTREASSDEKAALIVFIRAALTADEAYEQLLTLFELTGVSRARVLLGAAQMRIAAAFAQGQLTYEAIRG